MDTRQTAAAQCEVLSMAEMFVCVCVSDGKLGQYPLCPVHTLGSLSLSVVNPTASGEERGRLLEKQSALTTVYTHTHVRIFNGHDGVQ